MRRQYLTYFIFFWLAALLLVLQGCGTLNPMNWISDDGPDLDNDPVARAAYGLRPATAANPDSQAQIDLSDNVTLGMSMKRVRKLWGNPQEVDTAGDSILGNQRWIYFDGLSSHYSIRKPSQLVYFEKGRVAGWENRRE